MEKIKEMLKQGKKVYVGECMEAGLVMIEKRSIFMPITRQVPMLIIWMNMMS